MLALGAAALPSDDDAGDGGSLWIVAWFMLLALFGYLVRTTDWLGSVPGDLGDARFNAIVLEHLYRWVTGEVASLASPPWSFPFENVLALSDTHLGTCIPYMSLRWCGCCREAAFVGWFVVGHGLSFAAAFVVLRRAGLARFGSSIGAFVFAFALPMLVQEGHAQLVYRFPVPLAFAAWWRAAHGGGVVDAARACCWTALQFLCSPYLGVFLVMLLAATTAGMAVVGHGGSRTPSDLDPGRPTRVAVVVAACLAVGAVAVLLTWYRAVAADYGLKRHERELAELRPRPTSYLLAEGTYPWLTPSWADDVPMRHEHQLFFGLGPWLFLVAGSVVVARRSSHARLGMVSLGAFVLLFVATLDVGGHSFLHQLAKVPGMHAVRAMTRVVLVMLWPVAVVGAIGADAVAAALGPCRPLVRSAALTVAVIPFAVDVLSYSVYTTPIERWYERMARVAARLPRPLTANDVLFVTTEQDEPWFMAELDGMQFAQDRGVATLNGYGSFVLPGVHEPRPEYSFENRLLAYSFHRGAAGSSTPVSVGSVVVTTSASPSFDDCVPLRAMTGPVGREQATRLALTVHTTTVHAGRLRARVVARNRGAERLASVVVGAGPVRLSWRFVAAGGPEPRFEARQDLLWSLPPGGVQTAEISTDLPTEAGVYEFQVSVVQEGHAWLHALGMPLARATVVVDGECHAR